MIQLLIRAFLLDRCLMFSAKEKQSNIHQPKRREIEREMQKRTLIRVIQTFDESSEQSQTKNNVVDRSKFVVVNC